MARNLKLHKQTVVLENREFHHCLLAGVRRGRHHLRRPDHAGLHAVRNCAVRNYAVRIPGLRNSRACLCPGGIGSGRAPYVKRAYGSKRQVKTVCIMLIVGVTRLILFGGIPRVFYLGMISNIIAFPCAFAEGLP